MTALADSPRTVRIGWLRGAARMAAGAVLLAIAALAPPALADVSAPAVGSTAVASHQVIDFDWTDTARSRAVPTRLYWPSNLDAGHAVPLVVFSHGIGGSRRGYSYLGRYLAEHGIACLHLQHVGSDRELWFGNPLGMVGRLWDAANEREVIDRVHDLGFALDQLLDHSQLGRQIDRERIAAAGHSYGANTVMLASGARLQRGSRTIEPRDPRIKAALLISAPPFYGEADPAQILAPMTLPSLHITATEDVIRIPGYYSPASDRLAVFDATGSPAKALAVFEGGSHSMFTDRAGTGGAQLNPLVKGATRELALAFLRSVFDGKDDGLQQWPLQYRDLIARWVRRGP
jgi:predicted dienelactone hydrolase